MNNEKTNTVAPITPGFEDEMRQRESQPIASPVDTNPAYNPDLAQISQQQQYSSQLPTRQQKRSNPIPIIIVTILGVLTLLSGLSTVFAASTPGGVINVPIGLINVFIGIGLIARFNTARKVAIWVQLFNIVIFMFFISASPIVALMNIVLAITIIFCLSTKSVRRAFGSS